MSVGSFSRKNKNVNWEERDLIMVDSSKYEYI